MDQKSLNERNMKLVNLFICIVAFTTMTIWPVRDILTVADSY